MILQEISKPKTSFTALPEHIIDWIEAICGAKDEGWK
jgi:hypothetical protein